MMTVTENHLDLLRQFPSNFRFIVFQHSSDRSDSVLHSPEYFDYCFTSAAVDCMPHIWCHPSPHLQSLRRDSPLLLLVRFSIVCL